MAEYLIRGKPSVLGFCSGAVAGLVVVTPACGFVTASGAMIIGIAAGLIPFLACYKLKAWLGYDDALDTFGVHAVGGTLGAFLTGILARNSANANLALNLKDNVTDSLFQPLLLEQLKAIGLTLVLAVVGTVRHRLHRQGRRRPAGPRGSRNHRPGPRRARRRRLSRRRTTLTNFVTVCRCRVAAAEWRQRPARHRNDQTNENQNKPAK